MLPGVTQGVDPMAQNGPVSSSRKWYRGRCRQTRQQAPTSPPPRHSAAGPGQSPETAHNTTPAHPAPAQAANSLPLSLGWVPTKTLRSPPAPDPAAADRDAGQKTSSPSPHKGKPLFNGPRLPQYRQIPPRSFGLRIQWSYRPKALLTHITSSIPPCYASISPPNS